MLEILITAAAALLTTVVHAGVDTSIGEPKFRELYKELIETNTTLSSGSCTLAAERMAARLKAAGLPDADLHLFAARGHPKEGGLVAVYPGRDPFTLVEEKGNFYARGTFDDKAQASIWVDSLVRLREEKYRPLRTVKLALTCGEETNGAFNGAEWLVNNQRDLIDAEFAINEGAWGELDADGHKVLLQVQAGEKTAQDFRLEVTNPGGHSSRPMKDNAIYHLAGALTRIEHYEFPPQFADGSRAYFTGMAKIQAARGNTEVADAMRALLKDPNDAEAIALVSAKDPSWYAMLRTTCVATLLEAGHATNALPQRARANINCRIFPGEPLEAVLSKLQELAADHKVIVTSMKARGPSSPPPPLTRQIMGPIETLTAEFFPGVPVVPMLQPGATDGQFLNAGGIPTYGIEPQFVGADLGHIHGLNEYVSVQSLLESRVFLYRLIKLYADGK